MGEIDDRSEFRRFEQLVKQIDPGNRLLKIRLLTGGVSARTAAIEVEQADGLTRRMVVRCHGDVDYGLNPHIARDEFGLLTILRSAQVPVPRPIYVEESGQIFSRPCLVVEFVVGQTEFNPEDAGRYVELLADQLALIHTIDESRADLSFLPDQYQTVVRMLANEPETLDHSMSEPEIRATLSVTWPQRHRNIPALLHGDFWPGNVLWRDGQIAAVIDWEDAALGDPLADLANTRLEILWAFGSEAMQRFTRRYQSVAAIDFTDLPLWDLYAALRPASQLSGWGLDERTETAMREGHRLFVSQAFDSLSAS